MISRIELLSDFFFIFKQILDSADEMGDGIGLEADRGSCGGAKASQRINTTVHMCWHRNTSISYSDQLRAFQVSKKESIFIDASKVIRGK